MTLNYADLLAIDASRIFKRKLYYTGLPAKDETLETTVRTLYCSFPHIRDFPQL